MSEAADVMVSTLGARESGAFKKMDNQRAREMANFMMSNEGIKKKLKEYANMNKGELIKRAKASKDERKLIQKFYALGTGVQAALLGALMGISGFIALQLESVTSGVSSGDENLVMAIGFASTASKVLFGGAGFGVGQKMVSVIRSTKLTAVSGLFGIATGFGGGAIVHQLPVTQKLLASLPDLPFV